MSLTLRLRALTARILCAVFTCATHAEKLRITSTPRGAKVEINGVAVGATPFEKDYPAAIFTKPKPLSARASATHRGSLEF
jgi:hypothetical protein